MYKGTYESTNKGLGFELTNSMSFGKFVISAGLFQKIVKGDLFVKRNQGIIPWHIHGKVLQDTRGHHAEARPERPQVGLVGPTPMLAGTPWCPLASIFSNVPPPPPRVASTPFLKSI
jgi:hypothetical protein